MNKCLALFLLLTGCSSVNPELRAINSEVNQVPFVRDAGDDWKTPERFYKEGGDCEDYVIAKYTQIEKQKLAQDLQVGLVFDKASFQYHAVLIADGWVLDNQNKSVISLEQSKERYKYLWEGKLHGAPYREQFNKYAENVNVR